MLASPSLSWYHIGASARCDGVFICLRAEYSSSLTKNPTSFKSRKPHSSGRWCRQRLARDVGLFVLGVEWSVQVCGQCWGNTSPKNKKGLQGCMLSPVFPAWAFSMLAYLTIFTCASGSTWQAMNRWRCLSEKTLPMLAVGGWIYSTYQTRSGV